MLYQNNLHKLRYSIEYTTYTQSINTIYSARLFTLGYASGKPSSGVYIGNISNTYDIVQCTDAYSHNHQLLHAYGFLTADAIVLK